MSCSLNSFPQLRDSHYFSFPAMLAIKLCQSYLHHFPMVLSHFPPRVILLSGLWSRSPLLWTQNSDMTPIQGRPGKKQLLKWEMLSVLASCTFPCCSFLLPGVVPCISQFSQGSSISSCSHLDVCTHGPRCLPRELSVNEPSFSICCWTPSWQKGPAKTWIHRDHTKDHRHYTLFEAWF